MRGGRDMDTEFLVEAHIRCISGIEYSITAVRVSPVYTAEEKREKIDGFLAGIERHKGYLKEHLATLSTASIWWDRANHLVRQDEPEYEIPEAPKKRTPHKDQVHLARFEPRILFLEEFSGL